MKITNTVLLTTYILILTVLYSSTHTYEPTIIIRKIENEPYFDTVSELQDGSIIGAVGEEFESESFRSGIYKSKDKGRTWRLVKKFLKESYTPRNVRCVYVSQNGTVFVGGTRAIYVSNDHGETWYNSTSECFPLSQRNLWRVAETSNHTFFSGFHGGKAWIWRSDDFGHSWKNVTTGFGWIDDNVHEIKISRVNDWIYVVVGGNPQKDGTLNGRGLWRSKDLGKTWFHLIQATGYEKDIRLAVVLNETKMHHNCSEVGVFIGTESAEGASIYYFIDKGVDRRLFLDDVLEVMNLNSSWHGVVLWSAKVSNVFFFGVGCTGSSSGKLRGGVFATFDGKNFIEVDKLESVLQRKSYYFASSGWSMDTLYVSHRDGPRIIRVSRNFIINSILRIFSRSYNVIAFTPKKQAKIKDINFYYREHAKFRQQKLKERS